MAVGKQQCSLSILLHFRSSHSALFVLFTLWSVLLSELKLPSHRENLRYQFCANGIPQPSDKFESGYIIMDKQPYLNFFFYQSTFSFVAVILIIYHFHLLSQLNFFYVLNFVII